MRLNWNLVPFFGKKSRNAAYSTMDTQEIKTNNCVTKTKGLFVAVFLKRDNSCEAMCSNMTIQSFKFQLERRGFHVAIFFYEVIEN